MICRDVEGAEARRTDMMWKRHFVRGAYACCALLSQRFHILTYTLNSRRWLELPALIRGVGTMSVGSSSIPTFDMFRRQANNPSPCLTLEHIIVSCSLLSRRLRASAMPRPLLGRHYSRCQRHGCRPMLDRSNPNNMARLLA